MVESPDLGEPSALPLTRHMTLSKSLAAWRLSVPICLWAASQGCCGVRQGGLALSTHYRGASGHENTPRGEAGGEACGAGAATPKVMTVTVIYLMKRFLCVCVSVHPRSVSRNGQK